MVKIVCINKDGGNHQNPYLGITHFGWVNVNNSNKKGRSTRQQMVDFLISNPKQAFVESPAGQIAYCEVRYLEGDPYVITVADGRETNNLLNLLECVGYVSE